MNGKLPCSGWTLIGSIVSILLWGVMLALLIAMWN
jgi:type II secretory pathway pseudopilin PulG